MKTVLTCLLLLVSTSLLAQRQNVSGQINGPDGRIPDVSIREVDASHRVYNHTKADKNGLFSIEYYENKDNSVSSEACTWSWTDEAAQKLKLKLRDGSDFGNKFLSDDTTIKADFNPTGATFTLNTEIKGSKNYKATVTIVLR